MNVTIIARTPTTFTLQIEVPYSGSMLDFEEVLQDRLNDAAERLALVALCSRKGLYATSVRFAEEAFAEEPSSAVNLSKAYQQGDCAMMGNL